MNQQAIFQAKQQNRFVHPLSSGLLQRKCACGKHTIAGGECEECRQKREGIMQRVAVSTQSLIASDPTSPGIPFHGLSAGRPLESEMAEQARAGLGLLTDAVRIHDDSYGAQFARDEGAVAVTSGTDIYFAPHTYQPHTSTGRNLILHELAHVLQQHRTDGPAQGYRSQQGDVYEQEADQVARSGSFAVSTLTTMSSNSNVHQRRTPAEQIATVLRHAVEGLGTDEEAIFNALTGRTTAEIEDIKKAYEQLSGGETLEARLRSELSGDDLSRALSLLYGETATTEAARRLWNAVRGLGTDETAIYAVVAGRTAAQWAEIQQAYKQMTGEDLMTRLRDELSGSEWRYLQTLLPGAPGGAATAEDEATVIANRLQIALSSFFGADETAIYGALTGRDEAELQEIEKRFKLLTGEDLDVRLHNKLSKSAYAQAQQLLHPAPYPTQIAMRLHEAVEGPGTNESAIIAILTGRSSADLAQIRAEYLRMYGEVLSDRLKSEMSGSDLLESSILEKEGVLQPEDEIKLSVAGPGTDEERLFAVLTEISVDRNKVTQTIDRYAAKGYGDMLADIRDDLSGNDLDRAMELLHGKTPSGTCSIKDREKGLLAISTAVSLAQDAVAALDADISHGKLSGNVSDALERRFNPVRAPNAVNIALASQVRSVLNTARNDLLSVSDITCGALAPCVANPDCTKFTAAWTHAIPGELVRLCPAFFSCDDDDERSTTILHEFVHHTGRHDVKYVWESGFSSLTPPISLGNPDSYAFFARDLQ